MPDTDEKLEIFDSNCFYINMTEAEWDTGLLIANMDPAGLESALVDARAVSVKMEREALKHHATVLKMFPFWNYNLFKKHPAMRAYAFQIRVIDGEESVYYGIEYPAILTIDDKYDDPYYAQGFFNPFEYACSKNLTDDEEKAFNESPKMQAYFAVTEFLETLPPTFWWRIHGLNCIFRATNNTLHKEYNPDLKDDGKLFEVYIPEK